MDIKVTNTYLPEITRVVEFKVNGADYWLEYWVTKHSNDWEIFRVSDSATLTRDQQIELFNTNDDELNEKIDDLLSMAEDYQLDRDIEWREKVKAKSWASPTLNTALI